MNLLAFDTSTDVISIAVARGDQLWTHTGPGGSQASASLIPAIRNCMAQAGLGFADLDAIVFGRGPGSFTGLRTACAVAQGLAFGAQSATRPGGVPVLPVDTLLAVAEDARHQHGVHQVVAVLDARMDEVYTAPFEYDGTRWSGPDDFGLMAPQHVDVPAGLPLAGWVANCISPAPHRLEDYVHTLQQRIDAPLLGVMPYLPGQDAAKAADDLTIGLLSMLLR